MVFDLIIVGNASNALISAYYLLQQAPDTKLCIIGPSDRAMSASLAAGAMHAVYGELEENLFCKSENDDLIFSKCLESRAIWLEFLKSTGLFSEAITATDTVVYLKKDSSEFERRNFESLKSICSSLIPSDAYEIHLPDLLRLPKRNSIEKSFYIKNEFAFCPVLIFSYLDAYLRKSSHVTLIDDKADGIYTDSKLLSVKTERNGVHTGHKLLLAAGSNCGELAGSTIIKQPLFQQVGTAILLKEIDYTIFLNETQGRFPVLRSVNRGGAQCGFHVVPRSNGDLYVGAGSYLMREGRASHRLDTVRYLTNSLENEIFGTRIVYESKSEFLIGSRPRSFDGIPLVGVPNFDSRIFVSTGMGRVGFTLSPLIAQYVKQWFFDNKNDAAPAIWAPDRNPQSFGPFESALSYFVDSRIANALEHKLIRRQDISKKSKEFREWGSQAHARIIGSTNLGPNFVISPDFWGIMYNELKIGPAHFHQNGSALQT
jgi:glycine oxidase